MPGQLKESPEHNSDPAQTVLVVEDDVLIRMVIADYLRDCGYHVIEAKNADEAITILEKGDVEIDAVFSDVQMPGSMDGFALAQWVRKNHPGLDVVLTSGVARKAKDASDLCEETPFFDKPYNLADVEARLRALIAARRGKA